MVSCMGDLHVWSLKNSIIIPDGNTGVFTYLDDSKKDPTFAAEHPYKDEKKAYAESRDVTWAPKNKRPDKLKECLKESEELLANSRCVSCRWLNRHLLQIVLATGVIITYVVSIHTGDVDRIFIDKSIVGKLSSEMPSDILLTDNFMVASYADRQKVDYVYFMKKPENNKRFEKLWSFDPRMSQVDLPGCVGRRLERRLGLSLHQDLVLVWWPTASEEAWPWSPMTGEKERANLVIFAVNGPKLELVSYARTECDPLGISYSSVRSHQINSIEQSAASGGDVNLDVCIYECNRGKIDKYSTVTIPLKSPVTCFGWSEAEDKVLLACEDGSLVLYDEFTKLTHITKTHLVAHAISWHSSGTVIIVSSMKGEIQVFDLALSPINFFIVSESQSTTPTLDIAKYFRSPPAVSHLKWSPNEEQHILPECADSLLIFFERGPVSMLQLHLGVMGQGQLTPLALVNQYIKCRQLVNAISLLNGLSWNLDSSTCYACLSTIVNHLLRQPLNEETEGWLEGALATFYAPARPLTEVTVLEYRDPMSRLARRFFHHLLRFSRLEKAFLLAVDIGAKDLFMDIHYVAKDKGETALAEVALRKADQVDAQALSSNHVDGFDNDEGSFSEESDGTPDESYSSEEEYANMIAAAAAGMNQMNLANSHGNRLIDAIASQGIVSAPPPPPEFANPPLDQRFLPHPSSLSRQQQHLADMSEVALQNLEEELTAQMMDEYTETLLMEEPILPPPPSHADNEPESAVHVIHFGIV